MPSPVDPGDLSLLAASGPGVPADLFQAIHRRIDATPALSALLSNRHYTDGLPDPEAPTPTPAPYVVLTEPTYPRYYRTTGKRRVAERTIQAFFVADDPRTARELGRIWGLAFGQFMAPLATADTSVAFQATYRGGITASPGGKVAGKVRSGYVARSTFLVNEPAA